MIRHFFHHIFIFILELKKFFDNERGSIPFGNRLARSSTLSMTVTYSSCISLSTLLKFLKILIKNVQTFKIYTS